MKKTFVLAWLLTIRDWTRSLLIVGAAATAAGAVIGLESVLASAQHAIDSSVAADHAGRAYVAQAATPEAATALGELREADPLTLMEAAVYTDSHRINIPVHVVESSVVPWGILATGDRPGQGQVALFRSSAEALSVTIGDAVRITEQSGPMRVSGILVDPADSLRSGALVSDPGLSAQAVTFVSDTSFVMFSELQPFLDERLITWRSTALLAEDLTANLPTQVTALGALSQAFGAAGLLVVGVVIASTVASRARGREALNYAGLSPRASWLVEGLSTAVCIIGGSVLGAALVIVTLWSLRGRVSSSIGQAWRSLDVSAMTATIWTLVAAAACLAVGELVRAGVSVQDRLRMPVQIRRRWGRWVIGALTVGAILLGVSAASRVALIPTRQDLVLLAPWGAALIGAALPLALGLLGSRFLKPATAALVRHVGFGHAVAAGLAVTIAVFGAWYAGFTTHNVGLEEEMNTSPQPFGSFAIYEIPDAVIEEVSGAYKDLGGTEQVSWILPKEGSLGQVRVTSPSLTQCHRATPTDMMDDLPTICWPTQAASPVNLVALSASTGPASADPWLIENNHVGLLRFSPDGQVSTLPDEPVQSSSVLGGNLPGMVIPLQSRLAAELGLTPSGFSMLILMDFSSLSPESQARVRSLVSQSAGAAQTAEATPNVFYTLQRASARASAIGAACGVVMILLIAGATISAAHVHTRRTIIELLVRPGAQVQVVLGLFGPCAAALILASLLTWLAIRISVIPGPGGYGIGWLLPFAMGVLATAVAAVAWQRRPRS